MSTSWVAFQVRRVALGDGILECTECEQYHREQLESWGDARHFVLQLQAVGP